MEPFSSNGEEIQLRVVKSNLYLNETALPNDIGAFAYHQHVSTRLTSADVGTVSFAGLPSVAELETFLRLLEEASNPQPDPHKLHRLQGSITAQGLRSIEVSPLRAFGDGAHGLLTRDAAKRTYRKSVEVSRELFTEARLGRGANVAQVRQTVQRIVEGVLTDQASLEGLSALKQYDDYVFAHAVNVCIYCVTIGRRLGLSKVQLYDLGHAALVHDFG